ncbi:hypothetical protein G173_gp100 [Erwinia phage phiEaH2]|uniref:Uncharacterized protein n=1 Tax=Erwinia phage phiEaH2 TaxID=1029988 RepID=J7KKJ7_9CAUD|nr:hypothetical protein G173_gp100 [Erwinia phage phiEaH2]AFQ96645.1 hypothetical protein [Erwinia phage phiEaH2]
MQYEGYVVTQQPFVDTNLMRSQVVYADKGAAVEIARSRPTGQHISKVSIDITNPFITDKTDPFVDIGKIKPYVSREQFQQIAQGNPVELTETNEWERIQERHPGLGLMEVFHEFPDEFDKLPMWAEQLYNSTTVHDMLVMNNFDGAIHAVHGPYPGAVAYHTFHPARITFIKKVSL